ncbi:hypothetical protein ACFLSK_00510 [Chloroflexota bacterium]
MGSWSGGAGDGTRTRDNLLGRQSNTLKLLNNLSVTRFAELSTFSKSYISQVKHGKCSPSQKLLNVLASYSKPNEPEKDYFLIFLKSREAMGVSLNTLNYYKDRLSRFVHQVDYLKATRRVIERYLNTIPPNQYGLATRHASFRTIKTFYRWISTEYGMRNPINGMPAPILGKPILPILSASEVLYVIEQTGNVRDKTIIALFTESGLRLSELASIKPQDIDWDAHTIKSWARAGKRLMLHLVGYQSSISESGLSDITRMVISGASTKMGFRQCW